MAGMTYHHCKRDGVGDLAWRRGWEEQGWGGREGKCESGGVELETSVGMPEEKVP